MREHKEEFCSVCGKSNIEDTKFKYKTKLGDNLCNKHYLQLYRYGKILNRTERDPNEIIEYPNKGYAEIILYKASKKGEEPQEYARAIIDLDDIEKCRKYKWRLGADNHVCHGANSFFIHKHILNYKGDQCIDHIDRDPLNNRKSNLRIVTTQQNNFNTSISKINKSGIIGVGESGRKWYAELMLNREKVHREYFVEKDDAIMSRLQAEIKYFGHEFAPQRHLFEEYGIK